jgi:putative ABC transport system permease protein
MDALLQNLRIGIRGLRRDASYAAAVILTLALCLGAHTAVFTVVRSVLHRPLPYPEPERLVFGYDAFPGAGVERAGTSVPNYLDRRALTDVFDSVALYQWGGYGVGQGSSAVGVRAMNVTPSFFKVLRAQAAQGRLFREEEGTPGKNHVVVLSEAFAAQQARGGGDVVGREILMNNETYTVVGVLPGSFSFLSPEVRVYVPLAFSDQERSEESRWSQSHEQIARLAPGVALAAAQARIDTLNRRLLEGAGSLRTALLNAGYTSRVVFLEADLVRSVRPALQLLWGGVAFVLLIAAVNVTNLSLVRINARRREMATRSALGAGGARLTGQLVTETMVLTALGGAAGLFLGVWSLDGLAWLGLSDLPRAHEIRLDRSVLALTAGLAALLGVVVGAVSAFQIARTQLGRALSEEGRGSTAARGARAAQGGLVVAQVALAFLLLAGAGLLLESFRRLLGVDPGFVAQHVLTGRVNPLPARYPDDTVLRTYAGRALESIRALPGVEAAGISSYLPFSWDASSSVIVPEGYAMKPGDSLVSPNQLYVTPGYLEALRVALKRGRYITESDGPGAPRVILVDEPLAARFWPNADPLGRRVYLPKSPEDLATPGPDVEWLQVVGVVASVKLKGLVEGEDARVGAYYIPFAQAPSRNVGFAIRSRQDSPSLPAAVQHVVATLDPEMPLFDIFAMSDRVERSLNPRRAPMLLSLAFGAVALLLAIVGLYGVLAYQVSQRTREIGVRMALGSEPGQIVRLVLREGALLVVVGLLAGVLGAVLLRGVIASQLYGVGPLNVLVLLAVTGVLAAASLVACLGPARRASRVDPVVALSQ